MSANTPQHQQLAGFQTDVLLTDCLSGTVDLSRFQQRRECMCWTYVGAMSRQRATISQQCAFNELLLWLWVSVTTNPDITGKAGTRAKDAGQDAVHVMQIISVDTHDFVTVHATM